MAYILALDQGTTSSRAILFDHGGAVVAVAQQEFPQIFPKPGWVEHDPKEIWASQIAVAAEALARAQAGAAGRRRHRHHQPARNHRRLGPGDGRAGLQRHRLAGPAHGRPLRRAEGGRARDARAGAHRARDRRLLLRHQDRVDPRQRPRRAREGGRRAGWPSAPIDSWLVWKLTGGRVHVTDVSNASRTMLFNIHTLEWDEDLLRMLDVPPSLLPEVRASSEVYGRRVRPASASMACRSPASPATSRRRCSARCASSRAWRRTPTAPAASCCRTPATGPSRRTTGCSRRSPGRSAAGPSTPSKAASSSAARWCSGCATAWASSSTRRTSSASRPPCPTTAASTSCRRSPGSARRTGTRTPAAPSSASRAASTAGHIARAALESIAYQVGRPARRRAARRGHRAWPNCASTAAPRATTC